MGKKFFVAIVLFIPLVSLICSCASPESSVATSVAQTVEFDKAVAQAVSTGIAATMTAFPTATNTSTPSPTATNTATSTMTPTVPSTNTPTNTPEPSLTPSATLPPEPTETTTPTTAELTITRFYTTIHYLKKYAEKMSSGLGGSGTGYVACSRELNDSIVTNYDRIAGLEIFDVTLFSDRVIGANINYTTGKITILENADIEAVYNQCITWLDAGKPNDFDWQWPDLANGIAAADQAARLADAALNN